MDVIKEFPIERFKVSLEILKTFNEQEVKNGLYKEMFNPSNSTVPKYFIYKGSFMDCIECFYGFIPEVFREYCRYFDISVASKNGKESGVGYLDLMTAMKKTNGIDPSIYNLLINVFKTRGELIHDTLVDKDSYYKKLRWLSIKIHDSDLELLKSYVLRLCRLVNRCDTTRNKRLVLIPRTDNTNYSNSIKSSKIW